jgi:xanthine/CO dehydrogenase XdhC/CoxF family maturation factor
MTLRRTLHILTLATALGIGASALPVEAAPRVAVVPAVTQLGTDPLAVTADDALELWSAYTAAPDQKALDQFGYARDLVADEVVVSWPTPLFESRGHTLQARDAVCILTHDPKFDVPAVKGALATAVGYIGVMGSRTTHARRMERLAEVGITEAADLDRLMSPIGLDLGARTPEETAVSICAEIIARRSGRSSTSLRAASGPIH